MKVTGHRTLSVFERYNIMSPGHLVEAVRKLDAAIHAISSLDKNTGMKAPNWGSKDSKDL